MAFTELIYKFLVEIQNIFSKINHFKVKQKLLYMLLMGTINYFNRQEYWLIWILEWSRSRNQSNISRQLFVKCESFFKQQQKIKNPTKDKSRLTWHH